MDDSKLMKLRSLQAIPPLSEAYAAIASDDSNWEDAGLELFRLCGAWGRLFLDQYSQMSEEDNKKVLQAFDVALQQAWKDDDIKTADAIDEFASYLEDGIRSGKLPSKDVLLENVGKYLTNIVEPAGYGIK